jgi:N-acetylglutamate synthase-like GNAT family acetyltransferase
MVTIRQALSTDAVRIAKLLVQIAWSATPELVERKLSVLGKSLMDVVLVAENPDGIVGVVSLHVFELFHAEGRLGRITSLVVDATSRGEGVGKFLMEAFDRYFLEAGCIRTEVTSREHRKEAHAFYQANGYQSDERRFLKRYE